MCVQICAVDLQLQQFAQVNVELVPDNIALLTDTELTQYYIQAWSLDYNVHGTITILKLRQYMFQECKIKSLRPTVIFYLLSTDTDITRYYYAHVFVLGSPSDGLKTEIVFKRRLTNELLTTYLPSFLLLLMSYATTFFKPFYFEAAVTVNLSLLLVITTLFVR